MRTHRCLAEVALSHAELVYLNALPEPAHEVEGAMACELQAGHQGPHVVLGQTSGRGRDWWLRWLPETRELTLLTPCTAVSIDHPHRDRRHCLLPLDHEGGHSFELDTSVVKVTAAGSGSADLPAR
jgi:hypothetical protein